MATEVNKILLELEFDSKGVITNLDQVQEKLKRVGVGIDKVGGQFKNFGKAAKDGSDAAGIAGAAAAELGRTISDLPFGIQAVTNNVSQLGSMFSLLVVKTGSAKKAVSELIEVFKGPAGLLIIFQIAVAAVELFAQSQSKAKDEVQGLDAALKMQGKTYEELSGIVNNANESDERRLSVLKALAQFNDELTKVVNDENLTVQERIDLGNRLNQARIREREIQKAATDELIKRNELYANLTVSEEELQKRIERRAKTAQTLERGYVEVMQNGVLVQKQLNLEQRQQIETTLNGLDREINAIKEGIPIRDAIISQLESLSGHQESINDITEEYNKLTKSREQDTQKAIKAEEERIKIQEDALRRLQDQTDKFIRDEEASEIAQLDRSYQREIEAAEKVGADTTNIEEFYANERLRVKEEFADKRAKNERDTNYKIESAQRSHNIKMAQLEAKLAGDRIKNSDRTEAEILDAEISILESRIKVLKILAQTSDVAKQSLDEALIVLDDLIIKRQQVEEDLFKKAFGFTQEEFEKTAQNVQKGLDAAFGLIDAQFEKELALEERKTIALNDQLRERLRNEELTAQERDKINQEISKNEAKLVEKQNEIEEKRFKLNKAQGIANAVINTAVGITEVFPNIPMMAFIGALGAAQIATIASQKFVPTPMPAPTLTAQSGPSPQVQESLPPEFSVLGRSGINQLAETIEGQTRRPIKTYVVAGEVSTAQSLERNAVKEAGI